MTDGVFSPILKDVTFDVKKGEICGIIGENVLETKLIVEIVANLRKYYGGRVVLVERGMIQDKRYILPQLFFFNDNSMLFENMTVLEYVAFTQNLKTKEYAKMQKELLDELCAVGMDYISLTPINYLTNAEKMLVTLYTAYLTKSNIIVADFNETAFSARELGVLKNISRLIINAELAFLFATEQMDLIRAAATSYVRVRDGVSTSALPVREATVNERLIKIKRELIELLAENGVKGATIDDKNAVKDITDSIEIIEKLK